MLSGSCEAFLLYSHSRTGFAPLYIVLGVNLQFFGVSSYRTHSFHINQYTAREANEVFFVLKTQEGQSGLKGKLHDYFNPPEITAEKITPDGGLAFYVVTAKLYRGIIPWNSISEVCGKLRTKAITQNGTEPDPESGIRLFQPEIFAQRVLFNSAVTTLSKMQLDPHSVELCFVDENAAVTDIVYKLKDFACRLKVITNCTGIYEQIAKQLLKNFGLSLVIGNRVDDSVLTSTVLICADPLPVPLTYGGILITNKKRRLMNAAVLCGKELALAQKIRDLMPEGVDEMTFAGALYELCCVKELENTEYKSLLGNS